jgi:four helix bundle protein
MKEYSFEKLDVWKESRVLTKMIYELSAQFPSKEIYGLTSQIRRAAISVSLNIAEGSARPTVNDQAKSYKDAYGSLMEVLSALIIAADIEYMDEKEINVTYRPVIAKISNQLNALRNSIQNK